MRRKFKRRNRWADVLAAIILMGALVLAAFALRDYLRGRVLNFATAEEGVITLTLPGEIMVLRNEYVLLAPARGEFSPAAAEGERVKEGGLVGTVGGVAVAAPKGGAVSYQLDGWEQKLKIAEIYEMDWQQVFALLKEETAAAEPPEAEAPVPNNAANRPVARLVDNLLDYKVVLTLRDPRGLLAEAKNITFTLPGGKTFVNAVAKADFWEAVEGDMYYFFNISSKEDTLFSLRYSEVEVVAKEVHGIIIPSSAVTMDTQGRVGVFIQKKRQLVFTEIAELTSKDGMSVVEGLSSTAVVVTNPAKATDGQRIY